MAPFAKSAIIVLVSMAFCGVSMGVVHQVGDLAGWTIVTPIDYQKWAASKTFRVGDVLVFRYRNLFHNVLRVTHHNFNSCNTSFPNTVYSSGSDYIKLRRPGHFFFICGLPGHCRSGQKVHIEVLSPSGGVDHRRKPLSVSPNNSKVAPPPFIIMELPAAPTRAPTSSATTLMFNYVGVGDDSGWHPMFNYRKWAASKRFFVGDTIRFEYNAIFHNVLEVTKRNYRACNAAARPIGKYYSGNDTFVLTRPGHRYFLCSFPNHCRNGQRVEIYVHKVSRPRQTPPTPIPTPAAPGSISLPPLPSAMSPAGAPTGARARSSSSLLEPSYIHIIGLSFLALAFFV
ncbi:Plastocyanin-like protein [Corchorus capsularis]|uniref:Plastocyanin-like protein n=1 Tax=Corchorus capsularis TaxID=210143 RepID=A0A1R3I503_COCAP|nr:Plastocyanin-like protein [Corchorus capsularis]